MASRKHRAAARSATAVGQAPSSVQDPQGRWQRLFAFLFAPVDLASLALFRMVLGVTLFVEVLRYAGYGWIHRYYIEPTYYFTYPGFSWVRPWPGDGMYWHFGVMGVAAVCVALGLGYRLAMPVYALGISYVFLLDQTQYLNHIYLVCILCWQMSVIPAHRLWSLDVRLGRTRATDTVPRWTLWLIVGQLSVVYFFGGVAKLDGDWLTGAPGSAFLTNWELTEPLAGRPWAAVTFAVLGMLFDLLIAPALLWRRSRPFATVAVALFHLTNAKLFSIGIFPWLMLAATILFYPPAWPRRFLNRAKVRTLPEPVSARAQPWIVAGLAVWFAVQLLLPLRHWLYPGEVNWSELGHNFSWHMKLRNKSGELRLFAVNPRTGERMELDLREHLNPRQRRKMSTRPHMIQQFARNLGDRLERQTGVPLQITVWSKVSLNGREPALMIDPNADLRTASLEAIILPMPQTPPRLARGGD